MMKVTAVAKNEYPTVVDIWEASVRATHTFLPEADIQFFKPLILKGYLDAVALRCARDSDDSIADSRASAAIPLMVSANPIRSCTWNFVAESVPQH